MKDVTIIIPVHKLDDSVRTLLPNALESVKQQESKPDKVLIVSSNDKELLSFLENLDYKELEILVNEGDTDFASQINLGAKNVKTEWFSILEYDDEYSSIWFKNVKKYMESYENVDVFLPMIVDVNEVGEFIGFTNEAVWANSFSEELGLLDNESLLTYQNFNTDGMVIKTKLFLDNGGFKKHIKLTFIYEFLLRMTYLSSVIMVIPKLGYKHVNQRKGSLFHQYKEQINPVEAKWWLGKAKTEHYSTTDRVINYTE